MFGVDKDVEIGEEVIGFTPAVGRLLWVLCGWPQCCDATWLAVCKPGSAPANTDSGVL
jgi:hypothetical protein